MEPEERVSNMVFSFTMAFVWKQENWFTPVKPTYPQNHFDREFDDKPQKNAALYAQPI